MTGPFLTGERLTIADCVAMALLEFTDGFYGVAIPGKHSRLVDWHARMSTRPNRSPPIYPAELLSSARGLPEQTQCFI
jgi:glutathione S-transferase